MEDTRQDLREYSDNELSLQVFNNEYLYNIRHDSYLFEVLVETFIFNDSQLEVLREDIQAEKSE